MINNRINNAHTLNSRYLVSPLEALDICSFTEFFPFCKKLYYFSNFKDFNTFTQA